MKLPTEERIAELAIEALERTAMVMAESAEGEWARDLPRPGYFAGIDYSGARSGRLILSASEGFVRGLAASMLGTEPEEIDPAGPGQQALNELANIVGGSVILELGADRTRFDIGIPRALTADESAAPGGVTAVIDAEDEYLSVAWVPTANDRAAA